ncbi:M20/M25/M40 family metallo-hydrolase [Vaginella massiliensis]|uniref:M20/M25/M40 family metallo-hydrolase n=1 Tax=Vaginella massiliensis TaxID=1816680 RepID=UPI000838D611|nr:M20/M25/M40 family metallo-hydrolase [Vaginella massiliensis]
MSLKNHFQTTILVCATAFVTAQTPDAQQKFIENIQQEVYTSTHLEQMAFELLDGIGPRLVGSPQMEKANDWAMAKFKEWGVRGERHNYGQWRAWERGTSSVTMTYPRVLSLNATQLAWSPATKKPVEAEVIILPKNANDFEAWTNQVKGKIVLLSPYLPSGRPDYQLKEFATPETYERLTNEAKEAKKRHDDYLKAIGYNQAQLAEFLESKGAVGIAISNWSGIMGANRIFDAKTKKIPMIDIEFENYSMLYRLASNNKKTKIKLDVQSKDLGVAKTFNTLGYIEGKEKPQEYVILSAHFDSWDGAQGATDNGTGVITMMEVARLIKKYYPNNKRTIIVGLWGSEEQGLNGSRAFVKDHPEIVKNTQIVFNQDNGTGRVVNISGQGFVNAYEYWSRWLNAVPKEVSKHIETNFPGMPSGGGSDHSSFVSAGVPAFMLSSLNWGYFGYTWHTNKDTYDKIVFDEVRNNVVLIASLAYLASEEEGLIDREKRVLPVVDGKVATWPEVKEPNRKGRLD